MVTATASRVLSWVAIGSIAMVLAACDSSEHHGGTTHDSAHRLGVGDSFPEVVLPGLDRDDLLISQLRGKVVVLNVWATWCAPCRRELPSLQRLAEKLDPERFAVIGLSVDDDDHLPREYLIDRKIKLVSYIDREMKIVTETLGVQVYPDTYMIGVDGRLLINIEGEREWDSAEVVAALESAYAGDAEPLQGILHQDMRE